MVCSWTDLTETLCTACVLPESTRRWHKPRERASGLEPHRTIEQAE